MIPFVNFVKTATVLKLEYFIAKRIGEAKTNSYSKPVVWISYISIALGLALMIISVAVVIGFKQSISHKIIGFASHVQIIPFDNNESLEAKPLDITGSFVDSLRQHPDIKHLQFTARKAGVLKSEEQVQGIVIKGIDSGYDKAFLQESLVEGSFPDVSGEKTSNEVLVSVDLAKMMRLSIGDDVRLWFVSGEQAQARGRKLSIVGLYQTSLEEFDGVYIFGDLRHIRKLNNWNENQAGSIEIYLQHPDKLDEVASQLYRRIPYDLNLITVTNSYPQIFNWLALLDMNVIVILTILILVATITMISTLFILIIERTRMVGALKAMGANNASIRKIFLYRASSIILKGMLWGNIIGLAFYTLQYNFKLISLSPADYYVDYVPVSLSMPHFLLLNGGAFVACMLMLIVPSHYISRIVPAQALRYE